MHKLVITLTALALLSGCATLEEAYYVDREFGAGSQATWDRQIAHPDLRYTPNLPRGIDGNTAEAIMKRHQEGFLPKSSNPMNSTGQ